MANQLNMAKVTTIETLHKSGYSNRQIAAMLNVHRETVGKYLTEIQNRPQALAGSEDSKEPDPQPATSRSECVPYHDVIVQKLQQGLEAQRVYQDLVTEHGFTAKYHSVRRYVSRLKSSDEKLVRRMEVTPGQEAQIDFGTGAWIIDENGRKRRPWVFRIVLSYSRKGYSEAVYRQSTEAFIGALENAFHAIGGVPKTLVIDNLKAVVKRGDWYDPEIHPKLQSFAQHYGTVFLPTRPYTPEHKGKVESGIKYVQNNGLKGHSFDSLSEQNAHLADWERTVADTRIHGTTKKQVQKQFAEFEQEALLPLPVERFPFFHEGRRSVNRDGHVEVAKAYYSVPPEYIGHRLWVRWDSRLVRIFDDRWHQIAVHARVEPGRFRTDPNHIPKSRVSGIERGVDKLLEQAALLGPNVKEWSAAMTQARSVEGVRVLQGLKSLANKYPPNELDMACKTALSHGAWRLRTIRQLLKRGSGQQQQQFEFLAEHPVIRPLSDYSLDSLTQFRKERTHERHAD